jgi:hypothetical protein
MVLLRKKSFKYNMIAYMLTFLQKIIRILPIKYLTEIFYYIPHLIVILAFICDIIFFNKFYYIYYALFVFMLTSINKKIRYFMYVKDPLLDRQLYEYFYDEKNNYQIIHNQLTTWNHNFLEKKTMEFNFKIGSETLLQVLDDKEELASI